ncbi:MAG: GTP 3',8-cyclase MoaA [Planctomycetes bacterium]|nr:GTP 3',8-cyclase MoaA [Planctomycetota bacterium]
MATTPGLVDSYGRIARRLRLSITDRCMFRCVYCMPEQVVWMDRRHVLSFEELVRLSRIAVSLGVERIRVTGGEPLVRRDVPELLRALGGIPNLRDLSLTTNGVKLPEMAVALREAGLRRINISLDTLRRDRFVEIVRRDAFEDVLAGIRAAEAAGFEEIKLNCVVMRGINDDELVDFARFARDTGHQVRFIEFMPLDGDSIWDRSKVFTCEEILARVNAVFPTLPPRNEGTADPAREYAFADGRGAIGIIASVTRAFCQWCDRVRITADGKLRNCLFAVTETDLKTPLRAGASDDDIAALFRAGVYGKWAGHLINSPLYQKPERTMHAIGG